MPRCEHILLGDLRHWHLTVMRGDLAAIRGTSRLSNQNNDRCGEEKGWDVLQFWILTLGSGTRSQGMKRAGMSMVQLTQFNRFTFENVCLHCMELIHQMSGMLGVPLGARHVLWFCLRLTLASVGIPTNAILFHSHVLFQMFQRRFKNP